MHDSARSKPLVSWRRGSGRLAQYVAPGTTGGRGVHPHGKPIQSIREVFEAACSPAEIEGFTFHDLRHTAINNWRLQGHDYFRIMAATGHKTLKVCKRYNPVGEDELKALAGENR